jgi:putative oxidoreductase
MPVMTIITWILRLAIAAAFIAAAFFKLSGQQMMVDEFNVIGMGDWFRIFTGVVELVGAALVLYPATTAWGCLLLLMTMAGAFVAQMGPLHGDVVHVLVFAAVIAALLYLTRGLVTNRSGSKT